MANRTTAEDVETLNQVADQANQVMGELGDVERRLSLIQLAADEARQRVLDDARQEFDQLTANEEELKERLVALLGPNFDKLVKKGTKTVFLANGKFADKTSAAKLVIDGNETDAVADIRKLGLVRLFLRVKKTYSLDKTAIKKALTEANPQIIAKLKKVRGLATQQDRNWIITPNTTQVDIVLNRDPLKIPITEGD